MLIIERHQHLTELLRQRQTVGLEELARAVGVSASTVRRDLEALEARGILERTHGGAVYRGPDAAPMPETRLNPDATGHASAPPGGGGGGGGGGVGWGGGEVPLGARMGENTGLKRAIGRYAASLVEPNMTVMLDGGSTVIIAAGMIDARPIQVVTNSLPIAHVFQEDERAELVLAGGVLYPRTEVTTGPICTGTLADLHADLLLVSLAGIDQDAAFNLNMAMAGVEQVMMRQAARTVLLMDSTKFGRRSLIRVGALTEFDQIVTDTEIAPVWRDTLGDRLILAPPVDTAAD